jgi:hypothetical protein
MVDIGRHGDTMKENMKFETIVLVKKLNPPIKVNRNTKRFNINWKMEDAAHLLHYDEENDGNWTTELDTNKANNSAKGKGGKGLVLQVPEINFSINAK